MKDPMLETAYYLTIHPLEVLLRSVLASSYEFTGSPGLAILMLSLVFNVLLLPAYHFAEKIQDRERAIQKKLRPKIEEFKSVFQGQEKYIMLHTLYRQNNYHPVYALRALLPVFIQAPLFIATFHLLANFKPMYGHPFAMFSDLGKPDGILWGVNCMPIVMTITNLLSGFVYTIQLEARDKMQIWIVALIFFVLLYRSPVGLVIYWTFSNIFSLLKNLLYMRVAVYNTRRLQECQ